MFNGVKRLTLPNQCMSLQEMLRRFVRREPLPVEKKGVYIETEYDLEKLAKEDRVHQDEVIEIMKQDVEVKKAKAEKAKADKAAKEEAIKQQSDPKPDPVPETSPPKA